MHEELLSKSRYDQRSRKHAGITDKPRLLLLLSSQDNLVLDGGWSFYHWPFQGLFAIFWNVFLWLESMIVRAQPNPLSRRHLGRCDWVASFCDSSWTSQVVAYQFDQFAAGLEILKIYEPRSGIGCEKRGQTLFFDLSVTRDRRIE